MRVFYGVQELVVSCHHLVQQLQLIFNAGCFTEYSFLLQPAPVVLEGKNEQLKYLWDPSFAFGLRITN